MQRISGSKLSKEHTDWQTGTHNNTIHRRTDAQTEIQTKITFVTGLSLYIATTTQPLTGNESTIGLRQWHYA